MNKTECNYNKCLRCVTNGNDVCPQTMRQENNRSTKLQLH